MVKAPWLAIALLLASLGSAAAQTRLVILGDAAGRTSWRGLGEGSMAAAVQIGTDVYLVDFGSGWLDAFYQAGLAAPGDKSVPGGLETLRAGFITHLHADHVADYARLIQFGPTDGLQRRTSPVQVYGPGRVADATTLFPGVRNRSLMIRPGNPAPGLVDMTESLLDANAADINDNMSDGGRPSPRAYLQAHDIDLLARVDASPSRPAPRMSPFLVYQDEHLRVYATLVDHAPMFPAYGYRFETPDGVIAFSGDTSRNDNVIELAKGADVLVHEALDVNWPRRMLPEPRSSADDAKLRHLLEAHTDVAQLGMIAEAAGAKALVITHLGPPTTSDADYLSQVTVFSGKVMMGRRLFSLTLPIR